MKEHNVGLTAPEVGSLWKSYIQNTAVLCIIKHFVKHNNDSEIKPILKEQGNLLQSYIRETEKIFRDEDFPMPKGFSDEDVDLSAPSLYTDLYALSFVYRFNQMALGDYATSLTKVARKDVVAFFEMCLNSTTQLYKKSLNVMISKGIYDRAPKMSYPDEAEFIEKQENLLASWIGESRQLNVLEMSEIFYTIERNCIGILLLMGFIQVMKDKQIKEYLIKGKDLSQKQIDIFNKVLKKEQHIGNIPVTMEVTASTVSPFSERLILFLVAATTSPGIYLSAYSFSSSMRKDLATQYSLITTDIIKFAGEGMKIMVDRGWMEQPPQGINRKLLYQV